MATFSFDIASTYDKAEMNNVFASVGREISTRYDFKNTPAALEWIGDKTGFKLIGNSAWQIESMTDIIRKHLAQRSQSSKALDLSQKIVESNLKTTLDIPFVDGLTQDRAKEITKLLREVVPKVKATIQGDVVRVTSTSKDELQKTMQVVTAHGFEFPITYLNYR